MALSAGGVTVVAVVLPHGRKLFHVLGRAAGCQGSCIAVQIGMQALVIRGDLVGVAIGADLVRIGLANDAFMGGFLVIAATGATVTGDTAIAAMHRLKEALII